jgi:hypothetical protein
LKIRGSLFKDYVRLVRTTRDKDWDRFLTEDDWKIINSMIMPTKWYPVETMGRLAEGIYHLLTGCNSEVIREFGRTSAPRFFQNTMSLFQKDNIKSALDFWRLISDSNIDEVSVTIEECKPNLARVCYFPVDQVPSFEHYRELQAGNIEWLIMENGGKNPSSEFETKAREGGEACIIKVTWE